MIIIGKEGCEVCEEVRGKYPNSRYIEIPKISVGLGDTIHKLTSAMGITPCSNCRIRQYKLNRMFPYKNNIKKISPLVCMIKQYLFARGVVHFPVFMDDDLNLICIQDPVLQQTQ